VLAPYAKYPKTIQQAIFRVETHPSFSVLTRSMRKVLKAFLTRASKKDGAEPVRARVDRLAEQAGVCNKTVQRTISRLRKLGWMKQMSDGRSEYGVFTYREYQFTQELCDLVALPVPGEEPSRGTDLSDGTIEDLSFKKDQLEISKKNRKGKIDLPPVLEEAAEVLEVQPTGICKLRGLAHKAGHQLEDIITCARSRLAKLKATGNRAYKYLKSMIERNSDYASRAAQIGRVEIVGTTGPLGEGRYRNCRYAGPDGMLVRVFDGIAEIVMGDRRVVMLAGAEMQQIYSRIESGVLRKIAG
jgi:hypothetical protein